MHVAVKHPRPSRQVGLGGLIAEWGGVLGFRGEWLGVLWQVARSVIMVQDEGGGVALVCGGSKCRPDLLSNRCNSGLCVVWRE